MIRSTGSGQAHSTNPSPDSRLASLGSGQGLRASVIIPNWNGAHLLRPCLDSLRQQSITHSTGSGQAEFEVIVVDNASQDESVKLVEREYPEVRLLSLERNYRFAGAVNRGIQVAQADILALLNNDTEVEPGWLEALLKALDEDPEAGMAASKILLFDQRNLLHSAGDFYALNGIPGNRGVWQEDRGQYDNDREVFGGCGAAVAYRRSMLDDIGLFDEDLEMYCEDVDLNLRARMAGYRCLYVPEARVYHRLSATGGGPLASFYCGRNFIGLLAKDIPRDLLKRYWRDIARAQLRYTGESLRHIREPAARARLFGQLAGLAFIPSMVRKRPAIQAARRISVEELEALLTPAQ